MSTPSPTPAHRPPPIPARVWKIAAVTGTGAFMAMLDSTVVNLALEAIRGDLGSTLARVQWLVTGYLAALALSLPAAGWLGRRFGHGRVWSAATLGFVVASALCGVAPGVASLIAARLLQGLAAGVMVPSGQALLGAEAGPRQLGRLMGTLGLVVSLGPAVGPALGGFVLELASWRWLFWLNLPVGGLALALARGLVPPGEPRRDQPFDAAGLALLGLGLALLLYGGGRSGSHPGDAAALLLAGAGALSMAAFAVLALRAASPIVDLRLFRRRRFAAATATSFSTGASMYGGLLLLPLYLQLDADRDIAAVGLLLLAMGLGSAVALPIAGALTDRHGARAISRAGSALLLATTLPFLGPPLTSTPALVALLVVRGVGMAWAQMPAMTAAYASVRSDQMGDAATLVNIAQRVGGAAGAISVVALSVHSGAPATWPFAALALWSVAAFATASALPSVSRATA